jgi:hypothetical protein
MASLKTDAFTGTNGTLLNTYDANWVVQAGADCEIQSNALANNTTGRAIVRYNGVTWPNDQYSQMTIVSVNTWIEAACVRMAIGGGAVTYYGAGHNNAEYGHKRYAIWAYKAGIFTNLAAHGSQLVTIGDIVRLKVVTSGGNADLSLYVNDMVTPLLTVTDSSSALGSGQAGIEIWHGTASVAAVDSFDGGDLTLAATSGVVVVRTVPGGTGGTMTLTRTAP